MLQDDEEDGEGDDDMDEDYEDYDEECDPDYDPSKDVGYFHLALSCVFSLISLCIQVFKLGKFSPKV